MTKINFTQEHQAELDTLLLDALYNNTVFKGKVGSTVTVSDLLHTCSPNTLTEMQANLKKEVSKIDDLDEFTLTDYQIQKQSYLKKQARLVNLVLGYIRNQDQLKAEKARIADLKQTYNKLKEDTKTPEQRLKEMEAELTLAGVSLS